MTDHTQSPRPDSPLRRALGWMSAATAAFLAACATPPTPQPPAPVVVAPPQPAAVEEDARPALVSEAASPLEYRKDGARHIYERNANRIYKGQLPPLMHAVGVLQVEVDKMGNVSQLNWMRAPSHVPEVMREIERTVREAAPFPAPVRMGRVTYTDVWLWDKSGNFQLDTLTEGQRRK